MRLANFALLLSFVTGTLYAQRIPAGVNVTGTPLKIISITGTQNNLASAILVENLSGKEISNFEFALSVAVPQGCGRGEVVDSDFTLRNDRISIEPGAKKSLLTHSISPYRILTFGQINQSAFVYSQMSVSHVDFADGSSWNLKRSKKMFDDDMLAREALLNCKANKSSVSLAADSRSCTKVLRAQLGDGGGFYSCTAAASQVCSNAADARSCTNSICAGIGCPGQACSYNSGSVPVQGPPGDDY